VADPALLSRPPLNVLIDPSLARRKSPWEIDISQLLILFLRTISQSDTIDMRAAGTAALSSATIYRLKVETLFLFERLRAKRSLVDDSEPPQIIVMPFRYEVYSTNVDELFEELSRILQGIISRSSPESFRASFPMSRAGRSRVWCPSRSSRHRIWRNTLSRFRPSCRSTARFWSSGSGRQGKCCSRSWSRALTPSAPLASSSSSSSQPTAGR